MPAQTTGGILAESILIIAIMSRLARKVRRGEIGVTGGDDALPCVTERWNRGDSSQVNGNAVQQGAAPRPALLCFERRRVSAGR
jgi:hypothetical protein